MTSRAYQSAPSPAFPPPGPSPGPLPASFVPETCAVPRFAPLRVRGGRFGVWRAARRRGRAVAAGLAAAAAVVAVSGVRGPAAGADPAAGAVRAGRTGPPAVPARQAARDLVSAPVRIADGATVRLLRPGDRVDVIAAPAAPAGASAEDGGPEARIVVTGARVAAVPRAAEGEGGPPDGPHGPAGGGALLVLAVPRAAAPGLVAASATSHLAVVLC